jgi:hypothetical protein
MPALFRRSRRNEDEDVEAQGSRPSIVPLITSQFETGPAKEPISHREFRELLRDRARSQDEALTAIRAAARHDGRR